MDLVRKIENHFTTPFTLLEEKNFLLWKQVFNLISTNSFNIFIAGYLRYDGTNTICDILIAMSSLCVEELIMERKGKAIKIEQISFVAICEHLLNFFTDQ